MSNTTTINKNLTSPLARKSKKEKTIAFIWQHMMLAVALFIMTTGVALCVRSNLGSSVISSCPLAFAIAGERGLVPPLTLGEYTNILNVLLVGGQILVLRRRFHAVQLFQLLVGVVFGFFIDLNMAFTSSMVCDTLPLQALTQLAGCTIMAAGIALEIRCASVTMPGEGFPAAISKLTGRPFANVKIVVDIALVTAAACFCFLFFGHWMWNVVGVGTLFAMVYIGMAVKFLGRHLGWFDRVLGYRPGVRRYLYGLARLIYRRR